MSYPRSTDELVMRALMEAYPAPLTAEEIGAEIGDGIQAAVVLEHFVDHAIAHHTGGLYWLTRAARRSAQLASAQH